MLQERRVDGDVGRTEGVPPTLYLVDHLGGGAPQHRQRVVSDERGRVGSEELPGPLRDVGADDEQVHRQLDLVCPRARGGTYALRHAGDLVAAGEGPRREGDRVTDLRRPGQRHGSSGRDQDGRVTLAVELTQVLHDTGHGAQPIPR